jgi:hypothetical protein
MRVFDVETNWVGQLKSFVPPLEQKDARKEAKSLIHDGGLSLKDAMARTEALALSHDADSASASLRPSTDSTSRPWLACTLSIGGEAERKFRLRIQSRLEFDAMCRF